MSDAKEEDQHPNNRPRGTLIIYNQSSFEIIEESGFIFNDYSAFIV